MSVSLKYYGHSTFTVNADGVNLVIDPFFAPNNPLAADGATADTIDADFMILTHGHGDHVADAVSIAKRTGCQVISNFEVGNWLANQGVENLHQMSTGGGYNFPFGRLKMTIAHHGSQMPDGSYGGNPAGVLIYFNDGADIYFAGDTALTYDMRLIGEAGGVDLALLPIGDNFTMGPEDAVTAAQFVKAKRVIPIHYNTFPPIRQDPEAFVQMLQDAADIEGIVLKPGESYEL
ncbi:MAG: metal-dependent hydrolase [Caldilineaceae bacterium]|nr:metal-dependent hydrolase [Caldilineaceae bacterium]